MGSDKVVQHELTARWDYEQGEEHRDPHSVVASESGKNPGQFSGQQRYRGDVIAVGCSPPMSVLPQPALQQPTGAVGPAARQQPAPAADH